MDQLETFRQNEGTRTGAYGNEDKSVIVYPFDKYDIEIELTPDGKFLDIIGISFRKDFLSIMQKIQKIRSTGYLDLSKKYPEDSGEGDLE
ncbi:MAG: hypothetical protein M0Q13_07220 [Methanothrix sp.]|jgi:hypothetical protein|nr:hypothetical protein [Methanothrix sp.]